MTSEHASASTRRVVIACTGNAARSVMGGFLLRRHSAQRPIEIELITAGTHAIDGLPMSLRTRQAMANAGLGLSDEEAWGHRSHQLQPRDLVGADLLVVMEWDHLRYVRKQLPQAAAITATLPYLVDHLVGGDEPLAVRVAQLDLANVDIEDQAEVVDPAGQDLDAYVECALELDALVSALVKLL